MPEYTRVLVWFRRDLRDYDHAALYHALKQAREAVCAFVFDREILDVLPEPADRRVEFIHAAVEAALLDRSVAVHHYKDAVIFECEEVLTAGKTPFSVLTPYKNAWARWSVWITPSPSLTTRPSAYTHWPCSSPGKQSPHFSLPDSQP